MLFKPIRSSSAPHSERVALFRWVWRGLTACFAQDDQAADQPTAAINQPATPQCEARVVDRNAASIAPRILLVAHDPALCQRLAPTLTRAEYAVQVINRGMDVLDVLRVQKPDLVVIQRQLPDIDGLELCRLLRRQTHTPIMMFAPSADKNATILALENGADDVIDSLSSLPVFVARVRAILRRYPHVR